MSEHVEPFGMTHDGDAVERATITGGGLTAHILTYGAVLQDLRLEGHDAPLVLGFEELAHYLDHSPYFGATPGRYANRIGGARFRLDGTEHELDANFLERHTLHGGARGIGKRVWTIADAGTSHVDLTLDDPDGAMGFPGNCRHTCCYRVGGDGALTVTLTSRTDAPTMAGLTHHSYFVLDDTGSVLDHALQIEADAYLATDDELIPTERTGVEGTPFDFRQPTAIGARIEDGFFYDHNWCLSHEATNLRRVATLTSHASGVTMTVETTEPGVQFYAGHKLKVPVPGLGGRSYGPHAGAALECQRWPDAPNRPDFPRARLDPDEELRQVTRYSFAGN